MLPVSLPPSFSSVTGVAEGGWPNPRERERQRGGGEEEKEEGGGGERKRDSMHISFLAMHQSVDLMYRAMHGIAKMFVYLCRWTLLNCVQL